MIAPTNEKRFERWKANGNKLPKGRYLVKDYVDVKKRLVEDPTLLLDEDDFVGKVEIENAKWQVGFPKAEMISGDDLAVK